LLTAATFTIPLPEDAIRNILVTVPLPENTARDMRPSVLKVALNRGLKLSLSFNCMGQGLYSFHQQYTRKSDSGLDLTEDISQRGLFKDVCGVIHLLLC
jgi:hypothetical protein